MNCPKCNVTLVMSERQGIEIDYCPTCRGVWLDRGELDKIIERSAQPLAQPGYNTQTRMHDGRDYKHDDYYKHKKKSWLNDIFD
jgi:Zn-finger nucleic acid-binding protein